MLLNLCGGSFLLAGDRLLQGLRKKDGEKGMTMMDTIESVNKRTDIALRASNPFCSGLSGVKPVSIQFSGERKVKDKGFIKPRSGKGEITLTRYAEPMSCRGDSCMECGEIIEVYSQSGYCRACWHQRRLMSRPTAPGKKCWNCGNQEMKRYKTNKGKCFLKCPNCGATDNESANALANVRA